MALIADGSRICDRNRVAIGGIDDDVVLRDRGVPFIYAAGVFLDTGDSMLVASVHTHKFQWRKSGGAFADFTAVGAFANGLSLAETGATVLNHLVTVTNANKRTNQTATSTEGFAELAASGGPITVVTDLNGPASAEGQLPILATFAEPGSTYEIQLVCVHSGGTANLPMAAKIIVPELRKWYVMPPFIRN